ncbi:MAG: (d)CMP kinase [Desulfovibrionaceae bacterium]|nr:(d)CMP kinase [Desulfovibrionaceae bacterium]
MKSGLPFVHITLDGPAGAGKSSLARLLAEKLGLPFLDTGAMFRCIALRLGEKKLGLSGEELAGELHKLDFTLSGEGGTFVLLCNGKDPGPAIRSEAVGDLASRFAALPEVREFTRAKQRSIGEGSSLVAEGRDLGTAVFPRARVKFFLEARAEVRAGRRQKQLAAQGSRERLEDLAEQIRRRDDLDRGRSLDPLRPAEDAVIIDTSDLSLEEVLEELLQRARPACGL